MSMCMSSKGGSITDLMVEEEAWLHHANQWPAGCSNVCENDLAVRNDEDDADSK